MLDTGYDVRSNSEKLILHNSLEMVQMLLLLANIMMLIKLF